MNKLQVERLVRRIALTLEAELDCDECGQMAPGVVEALLSGDVQAEHFTLVFQHLAECLPCAEEFDVLKGCAQMDRDGSWPALAQMLEQISSADLSA